jgi:hypothetical protein
MGSQALGLRLDDNRLVDAAQQFRFFDKGQLNHFKRTKGFNAENTFSPITMSLQDFVFAAVNVSMPFLHSLKYC